jgi:type VI secretion system protein ImpA
MSESNLAGSQGLGGNAAPVPSTHPLAGPSATAGQAAASTVSSPAPQAGEVAEAGSSVVTPIARASAVDLDPAVAALCTPLSEADPFGPDLDFDGDGDYLNFFASAEGILPPLFFLAQDGGKTFFSTQDEQSVSCRAALPGLIEAMKPLLARTRDLRLLITRARLLILKQDLGGFAASLAAVAEWLDRSWDAVHPRPQAGDPGARVAALALLDLPTVVFPLQYAPLFEAQRIGAVTYRAWMIASSQVKPRPGEQKHDASALTDALADADPAVLASSRRHVALLRASLGRVHNAFFLRNVSWGLEDLPALVDRISAFIDPLASARDHAAAEASVEGAEPKKGDSGGFTAAGASPTTLAEAKDALAAIAGYYTRLEPSSPILPLVRQAHQLIGKSFIEVISILVPTQLEKAAFQIGADQVFELPVGKLPKLLETAPNVSPPAVGSTDGAGSSSYSVQTRVQAVALLDQVQQFFRAAEPSSPVPMLCERARTLAERDFMGVLRDVLPKAALKNAGADK